MNAFIDRWEPHFGAEPWWQSIAHVHEYVGDWDSPDALAIEALVYDLAKARGIPTETTCSRCGRLHDGFSCFECAACVRAAEKRGREIRQAATTIDPVVACLILNGLIVRDVQ